MTKLIFPSLKHRENAIDFINEFHEFGSQINGTADLDEYIKNNNYEAWLNKVEDFRGRMNIPADRVPALTYFYIREEDQKIVGMVDIRLELNDFLRKEGGHIGYCVRPTERNKHYATNMLKEALKILNDQGINEAVITCASDNKASIAVIENCGGVLEAECAVLLKQFFLM